MDLFDKKLNELLPNGIESKKITEYAETFIGLVTTMTKHYVDDGVPLIYNSNIKEGRIEFKERTFLDYEFANKNKSRMHKIGDVVTVHTGDVGTSAIIDSSLDGSLGFATIVSRIKDTNLIIPEYLCAFLNSGCCKNQIKKMIKGDRNNLNLKDFNNITIPVPTVDVQKIIVHYLDKLTTKNNDLLDSLNKELDLRRKQYSFYEKELFDHKYANRLMKIKDISLNISSGGTPLTSREDFYNGDIPWLRTQEVNFNEIWDTDIKITDSAVANSSAKIIPANCVIVAMYGATVGRVAINKISLTTNQACCNIEVNPDIVNYKYLFYYLMSKYKYIKSLGQGSQTNINSKIVKELEVPIPELDKQIEIMKSIDNIRKTIDELEKNINKEIELLKKEYEFYRNMVFDLMKGEV